MVLPYLRRGLAVPGSLGLFLEHESNGVRQDPHVDHHSGVKI